MTLNDRPSGAPGVREVPKPSAARVPGAAAARSRPRATVETVAAHAGVSRQTVSNALNAPARLRPQTLERVMRSIDTLGYRPNQAARALRTRAAQAIGCRLFPPSRRGSGGILDRYLYALSVAAHKAQYGLLCHAAESDGDEIAVFEELIRGNTVDGFIITATQYDDRRAAWLLGRDVPFVSFGRTWGLDMSRYSWVDVDGAAGARAAVGHLADQGHQRIAFLGWPRPNGVGEDRESGWEQAMGSRGLTTRGLVRRGDDSVDGGALLTRELFDVADPPTAFVCASDAMAIGALHEVEDRGLRPGRDIGIVGFDDSVAAHMVRPALSSVNQPLELAAEHSLRMLLGALGSAPGPEGVLLTPSLVVRASSVRSG